MVKRIELGDIKADVILKDIKNIHLSVNPPAGTVRISAPLRMDIDTIRVFAISKLGWIKRQQKRLLEQERETPRDYIDRENHFVWGKRYLLKVIESNEPSSIELMHSLMVLRIRPGLPTNKKAKFVEDWYRDQLKKEILPLIEKWEPILKVKVEQFFVQKMKTRWGSCNHSKHNIRINTDLAKKPRECLEYIVVHEMVHLLEPSHNARFVALMENYIPKWKHLRDKLNNLPVRHEEWIY